MDWRLKLAQELSIALVVGRVPALCAWLKKRFAKKPTQAQLIEALQEDFKMQQVQASRVVKGIFMKGVILEGRSISINAKNKPISFQNSDLLTSKASIRMKKVNVDDDSSIDINPGTSTKVTDKGDIELES